MKYGVVKRASTKRQAPSPPGGREGGGRRVVSSDREERLVANGRQALYGNGVHPESNYRWVWEYFDLGWRDLHFTRNNLQNHHIIPH